MCGLEDILFREYLSGRHQYVDYNDAKSETKSVSIGVPQGSILEPLLCLIYINDLPSVTPIFHMLMYADDTALYCNLNGVNSEVTISNELSKISEWLSSNKLSLNIKKTKFLVCDIYTLVGLRYRQIIVLYGLLVINLFFYSFIRNIMYLVG